MIIIKPFVYRTLCNLYAIKNGLSSELRLKAEQYIKDFNDQPESVRNGDFAVFQNIEEKIEEAQESSNPLEIKTQAYGAWLTGDIWFDDNNGWRLWISRDNVNWMVSKVIGAGVTWLVKWATRVACVAANIWAWACGLIAWVLGAFVGWLVNKGTRWIANRLNSRGLNLWFWAWGANAQLGRNYVW